VRKRPSPPSPPEPSIIRSTLRGLLAPRRLLPIVLLSASLVAAQGNYSRDPFAIPLGIAMCIAFSIVAPVSWRVLFPDRFNLRHGGIRLILYVAIAAGVVFSLGVVAPQVLHMGHTLLTARTSVVVCLALFLVGGWGLGRHMWLENELARAEARATLLAREAEGAQLLALRSHLDPHFLFNTLNAIAEWCREDGETAERAVVRLSAMLRTVLAGVRASTWPLADELALLDTLFELHRLRDPDRVRVRRHLPDPLPEIAVPPMLLLPLAENAVKHGPAAGHEGEIVVAARTTEDERLVLSIENPGAYRGRRPGGSGIEIVERRLALAYDDQAMLTIAAVGETTRAEVTLPLAAHPSGSPT